MLRDPSGDYDGPVFWTFSSGAVRRTLSANAWPVGGSGR
jgi:hypothetical protein